jgi:hypothetical protein
VSLAISDDGSDFPGELTRVHELLLTGAPIADLAGHSHHQEQAMSLLSERIADVNPTAAGGEEGELCTRVQAEFREMPGLTLTLPQAARLFCIELTRCEHVLGALVHAGHLATDGKAFASPGGGRRSA